LPVKLFVNEVKEPDGVVFEDDLSLEPCDTVEVVGECDDELLHSWKVMLKKSSIPLSGVSEQQDEIEGSVSAGGVLPKSADGGCDSTHSGLRECSAEPKADPKLSDIFFSFTGKLADIWS
jgi:hypothetical protein